MNTVFPPSVSPPLVRAVLRARPEDFVVEERCPVVPAPGGEHLWVRVRKRGWNTPDVARVLARAAGLRVRDVGYAGLKDRNALTTQWFSLWLRNRREPGLTRLPEGVEVLERVRCARKLRRGAHTGNRFMVRLHAVEGDGPALQRTLERMAAEGFPNYFGPQRFGRNGRNVAQALVLFRCGVGEGPRHLRSIRISAARAWIFNHVLAERVAEGSWSSLIDGDLPEGFGAPTGPLWGVGGSPATGRAGLLEVGVAARFAELRDGLERTGMAPQRRALVARPEGLSWALDEPPGGLTLRFGLGPGVYATALLAELVAPAREPAAGCKTSQPLRRRSTYKAPVPPSTGRAEV